VEETSFFHPGKQGRIALFLIFKWPLLSSLPFLR
jgi:hypothetical protein